jgi:hypothetical protein
MNFTPHTVQLSVSIEQEKQDLQKQIDNYNLLISNDMSFIKDKQKEVKQLKYKLDEFIQKDPFISINNSYSTSSSSPYSLLSPEELPQNWSDKQMRDYITQKNVKYHER